MLIIERKEWEITLGCFVRAVEPEPEGAEVGPFPAQLTFTVRAANKEAAMKDVARQLSKAVAGPEIIQWPVVTGKLL